MTNERPALFTYIPLGMLSLKPLAEGSFSYVAEGSAVDALRFVIPELPQPLEVQRIEHEDRVLFDKPTNAADFGPHAQGIVIEPLCIEPGQSLRVRVRSLADCSATWGAQLYARIGHPTPAQLQTHRAWKQSQEPTPEELAERKARHEAAKREAREANRRRQEEAKRTGKPRPPPPGNWPPPERAPTAGVIQLDYWYSEEHYNPTPVPPAPDFRRLKARVCNRCGCYARPQIHDPEEDKPDLRCCGRADQVCWVTDEGEDWTDPCPDVPYLGFWLSEANQQWYFAPTACAECSNKRGCDWPHNGWDFTAEWVEPNTAKLGRADTAVAVASCGSAAEAVALAREHAGYAWAHRIENNSREQAIKLWPGILADWMQEAEPPELERIPTSSEV